MRRKLARQLGVTEEALGFDHLPEESEVD